MSLKVMSTISTTSSSPLLVLQPNWEKGQISFVPRMQDASKADRFVHDCHSSKIDQSLITELNILWPLVSIAAGTVCLRNRNPLEVPPHFALAVRDSVLKAAHTRTDSLELLPKSRRNSVRHWIHHVESFFITLIRTLWYWLGVIIGIDSDTSLSPKALQVAK